MSYVVDLRVKRSPKFGRRLVLSLSLPELKRRLNWMLVVMMLITIAAPIFDALWTGARYDLRASASLLGNPNPKLATKISFDQSKQLYQFNKEGLKTGNQEPSVGVGNDSHLYSADLPVDAGKGIKLYDNVNNLSVSFVPQFPTLDAKQKDNRLVYPLSAASPQMVYTAKANGLKEDLILPTPVADSQTFRYHLDLGSDLEARMDGDGVGIYSTDPHLFGNVSFGSDTDRQSVENARRNGKKDYLVFYVPAPQIHQSGKSRANPSANFRLDGDVLTVTATGLSRAAYPLSIDPSFVVTSANDWQNGNNESGIDASGNDLIRAGLTGGTVASWTTETAHTPEAGAGKAVTYGGYLYVFFGSAPMNAYYAPLSCLDNSANCFTQTSGISIISNREVVAYNGYIYVIGGAAGGSRYAFYAKINSDGSLGTFNTTSLYTTGRALFALGAYNGYLYLSGGYSSAQTGNLCPPVCSGQETYYATVQKAPINANGSLGTWTSAGTNFGTGRDAHAMPIYNGYMYINGGYDGGDNLRQVQYAKIGSDGNVSTWTTTTSTPTTLVAAFVQTVNGYMYGGGGSTGNTTLGYAAINADGSLGTWQTTTSMPNAAYAGGFTSYNGTLYAVAGCDVSPCGTSFDTILKAKVDPAGVVGNYTDDTTHNLPTGSWGAGTTVYNGVIYVVGGCQAALATCESSSATDYLNTVYRNTLSSTGTLGTWTNVASEVLPTSEAGIKAGRFGAGVVAYNGYLYVAKGDAYTTIGGQTQKSDVLYSKINANGSLANPGCGTVWCVAATDTVAQGRMATVVYNGYLYMIAGDGGAGGSGPNQGGDQTRMAQLKSDGSINGFSYPGPGGTAVTLDNKVLGLAGVATNGYIYVFGGRKSTGGGAGNYISTVESIQLNSDGTFNGSWTNVGSMPNIKAFESAVVNNGYVYIVGGVNKINTTFTIFNDTTFARLKSDGTLDTQTCSDGSTATWCTTQSMAVARFGAGGVVAGGYLYEIGGCEGLNGSDNCNPSPTTNYAADTEYAPINNGGTGALGAFTSTTAFDSAGRNQHSTVAYNGHLYVIGGANPNTSNSVRFATINADGTVGSWADTTNMLSPLTGGQAVAYNGYMYYLGGFNSGNGGAQSATYYARINSDGTLGFWANSTFMLNGRYYFGAGAYNGYMYAVGGCCPSATNEYARVNSDGTLGTWTAATSLNIARWGLTTVIHNGYVYAMGGCSTVSNNCNTNLLNTVESAQINSGGSLGTWQYTTSFNLPHFDFTAWESNGYIYIGGGCTAISLSVCTTLSNDLQYAPVLANGKVGAWASSGTFTTARNVFSGAVYNGKAYFTGGCQATFNVAVGTCGTALTDTQYATINAIPRVGHYSRLLDSDVDVAPTKLVANGSTAAGGSISLSYQTAKSSAPTLANSQNPALTLATPLAITPDTGGVDRYYWLNFTLDDSESGVFPDTTASSLSDFSLYYHPAPSKRLRGGKTFTGNAQQSLDASP